MWDKIRLKYSDKENKVDLEELLSYCEKSSIEYHNKGDMNNNEIKNSNIKAIYKGLSIEIYNNETRTYYIDGSLSKFYFKNNFQSLNLEDTEKALLKLDRGLNLPIMDMNVTMLEFGANFIVDESIENYLNLFGIHSKMSKTAPKENTIYYQSLGRTKGNLHRMGKNNRAVTFYDKVDEYRNKNKTIPKIYENKNVLRYELRYNNNIRKQLSKWLNDTDIKTINASTLFNPLFCKIVLDEYKNIYNSIQKIEPISVELEGITTMSEAFNVFVSKMLYDNKDKIEPYLNKVKREAKFKHRNYNTNLKTRFSEALNNPLLKTNKKSIIDELNEKVEGLKIV